VKPTHYLNLGAGLVLLILFLMVGLIWLGSSRVAQQHLAYREGQLELQELDRMRASINRIVSSTNEIALIAMTDEAATKSESEPAPEATTEASAEPAAGEADEKGEAVERENNLIKTATEEFRAAESLMAKQNPVSATWIAELSPAFDELIEINASLGAEINRNNRSTETIFALKEKQEEAEMAVLTKVGSERDRVTAIMQAGASTLTKSFVDLSQYALAGGLLAALILLASNSYIGRRVGGMFTELDLQRDNVEKANGDLNTALSTLRQVQNDLVHKEKFATLGRLTATVSHELRNPLAAIRNSSFIIRQSATDVPSIGSFIDRIDRNVTRCDHIIADLLEYTKTRALELHHTEVGAWLETSIREQVNLPGIELVFNRAEKGVFAHIDQQRFIRAIINLVENAGQAIATDKTRTDGKISVACSSENGQARIMISDNGPGIPAHLQSKIFEPLFTTKNFGAGLGLSITRNLVTEHRGTIQVVSEAGQGTTFTITLPLADHDAFSGVAA
jgi:signal transduction histidine kinase